MIARVAFTYLIWAMTYVPMIALSIITVPLMLGLGWDGYTTWFGNRKYGRYGNDAYRTRRQWQEFVFLVVRNPVSNFGKEVMSHTVAAPVTIEGNPAITDGAPGITGWYYARSGWAWEVRAVYRTFPGRCFEGRWGWKLAGKAIGDECTFVCRANPLKRFG